MKRILAFLMVGLMIFMMSACSYNLVEVEDLNKDQGEKVLDNWQEEYGDFVVDVQSDAEDAAKAEEEEEKKKKEEEEKKKKQEAVKKKQEAAQNKTEKPQTQTPIVENPIVEQVIEQPFISETFPQPDPIPEPTPEPVPQPEPEQYSYDNPPVRGSNNEDIYNNDYIGLNIRWPEGWESFTNEQDQSLKRLLDEEYSTVSICDLLAVGPGDAMVEIMYTNLRKAEREDLTAEGYLAHIGETIGELDEYIGHVEELHTAYLGGNEWSVQPIIYKDGREEVYITYYARKIDCFLVTMVLTSPNGAGLHLEFY